MSKGNKQKDMLLGEPHGTAANRLRRAIIFMLAGQCGLLVCHRCGGQISIVADLSIEHKTAWQSAPDPREAFFDLKNIAFSHLRCNIGTGKRPHKKYETAAERQGAQAGYQQAWRRRQPPEVLSTLRRDKYRRNGT